MSRQRFPCSDRESDDKRSGVVIEFGLKQGFYVATKCFYVATELDEVKRIHVATEYSYIATEFSLDRRF